MIGNVQFETDRLIQKLRAIQPEMKKGMTQLTKDAAKLAVRKAVEMTPPGEINMGAQDAKKRGENAIAIDLFGGKRGTGAAQNKTARRMGIFFGVKESILKKFENTGGVAGSKVKIKARSAKDDEILFIKKDGTVYATQKQFYRPNASIAEMEAHHRRYFKNGHMTSSVSGLATTGQWVFVDSFVTTTKNLTSFLTFLRKRVGIWAAGWMPAIEKLTISRVPAWIRRHSAIAKGRCDFVESGDRFEIVIANSTGYGSLSRIVPYAIAAARAGMDAQFKHIKAKALARAGFRSPGGSSRKAA